MPVLAAQVEDSLEKEVKQVTYELEGDLKSFGKGFTVIEQVRAKQWLPVPAWCCAAQQPCTALELVLLGLMPEVGRASWQRLCE